MKRFKVTLKQTLSAAEYIEAADAEEAEEIAMERFMDCEIELTDSGIPYDVDITVNEISEEDSE